METILYFHTHEETSANELLAGVRDASDRLRLHVQVINFLPDVGQAADLVNCWHPVGVIVECGGYAADVRSSWFAPLPVVFLDVDPRTVRPNDLAVCHDSCETGVLAAKELMMTGHRQFSYVDGPVVSLWSRERLKGFRKTLALNGHDMRTFLATAHTKTDPIAYQHALTRFIAGLSVPVAVFAATDTIGADVIATARQLGRRVPEELAVIGVNDSETICLHTKPTLTSIRLDFRGGGAAAVLLLAAVLRSRGRFVGSRRRTFGTVDVVRRASTRILRKSDPRVLAALDTIRREAASGLTSSAVVKRHFTCSRQFAERLFLQETGHSILDEIHVVQLGLVKRYLANPYQQLEQISSFCGFRNPNSLRKFFMRETGMTMSAWRRQVGEGK